MTPKQGVRLQRIINSCHDEIKRKGAHARMVIWMPGTWRERRTRRLCAQGPQGVICGRTHSGKKILVLFKAAELLTSMEVIRNANFTC